MEIGSKLPFLPLTLHRPHHLITYNKCAYICTTCFFNKLLYDDPGFHTLEGFYDRLGCLFCMRQNNPIPLSSFQKLHNQRCPSYALYHLGTLLTVIGIDGFCHSHPSTGEDLKASQVIS